MLQHPPHGGRDFREDTIPCEMPAPSLPLPLMWPWGAAGTCSPSAPKAGGEARCPLGLWESKRSSHTGSSAPTQHTACIQCLPRAALATPCKPSSRSLAPRCQHPLLAEQRWSTRLAANTHHMFPCRHSLTAHANGAREVEEPRTEPCSTPLSFLLAWLAELTTLETSKKADPYWNAEFHL